MEKEQFYSLLTSQTKYLIPQALKFTNDADDAKDLIQDTVLKAILNYDKFQEGTNFKGWLYTIMRNLFVNNYRKRKLNLCSSENEEAFEVQESVQAESLIAIDNIKKELEKLPTDYYGPLTMYVDGYKYHEITEKLSVPLGTVKNRIHLARKILQKTILQ